MKLFYRNLLLVICCTFVVSSLFVPASFSQVQNSQPIVISIAHAASTTDTDFQNEYTIEIEGFSFTAAVIESVKGFLDSILNKLGGLVSWIFISDETEVVDDINPTKDRNENTLAKTSNKKDDIFATQTASVSNSISFNSTTEEEVTTKTIAQATDIQSAASQWAQEQKATTTQSVTPAPVTSSVTTSSSQSSAAPITYNVTGLTQAQLNARLASFKTEMSDIMSIAIQTAAEELLKKQTNKLQSDKDNRNSSKAISRLESELNARIDAIGTTVTTVSSNGEFTSLTVGTTTLVVDSNSKNVGIGTTSPYAKLSVAGSIVGQNFVATSTTATSTFTGATFATTGGNVGIGTLTPNRKLTVSGSFSLANLFGSNGNGNVGILGDVNSFTGFMLGDGAYLTSGIRGFLNSTDGSVAFDSGAVSTNGSGLLTAENVSVGTNLYVDANGHFGGNVSATGTATFSSINFLPGSDRSIMVADNDLGLNGNSLTLGSGSTTEVGSSGGDLILRSGNGELVTNNQGSSAGDIKLLAGVAGQFGGNLDLMAGDSSQDGTGGTVNINAGNASWPGTGGNVNISAGTGAAGGTLTLRGGTGFTGSNSDAGALNLIGGAAGGVGHAGAINITGGSNTDSGGFGGSITINPGDGDTDGDVFIASARGNVGIGTSSLYPSSKLTVSGDSYFGGNITTTGSIVTGSATSTFNSAVTINNGNLAVKALHSNNVITLGSSAPVIGVDTLNGSDNKYLALTGGGATGSGRGANIFLEGNEYSGSFAGRLILAAGDVTGTDGEGSIRFWTASSVDRMTITRDGNVGIGTTTPSAQLSTTGTVQFSNFGAGTLQTDANGNLSVSSDERLKNVKGFFTRGLDAIRGINTVTYTWKPESGLETEGEYTGFSAQNVKEHIPEAVGEDKRGYLTLSDRGILATVVNAVKELGSFVDKIENGIAYLKDIAVKNLKVENITIQNTASPSKTGITIYDRVTNKPMCMFVADGDVETIEGACDDVTTNSDDVETSVSNDNATSTQEHASTTPALEPEENLITTDTEEVVIDTTLEEEASSTKEDTEEESSDIEPVEEEQKTEIDLSPEDSVDTATSTETQ